MVASIEEDNAPDGGEEQIEGFESGGFTNTFMADETKQTQQEGFVNVELDSQMAEEMSRLQNEYLDNLPDQIWANRMMVMYAVAHIGLVAYLLGYYKIMNREYRCGKRNFNFPNGRMLMVFLMPWQVILNDAINCTV